MSVQRRKSLGHHLDATLQAKDIVVSPYVLPRRLLKICFMLATFLLVAYSLIFLFLKNVLNKEREGLSTGKTWRPSQTSPMDYVNNEDYAVYIALIALATVVQAGLGFEFTVWMTIHPSKSGWNKRLQCWWHMAQFVFPLLGLVSLDLAFQQSYLFLLFLVVGIFKFGFPETLMYGYSALYLTCHHGGYLVEFEECSFYKNGFKRGVEQKKPPGMPRFRTGSKNEIDCDELAESLVRPASPGSATVDCDELAESLAGGRSTFAGAKPTIASKRRSKLTKRPSNIYASSSQTPLTKEKSAIMTGHHADKELKKNHAQNVVLIYLLAVFIAGHVSINFQLALGCFFAFHLWGLLWIKILLYSPNIYRIQVPTMVFPDWVQLSIPSNEVLNIRKDRVVSSISELSGIRGTHLLVALRTSLAITNVLILVAIQQDLHHRGAVFGRVASDADLVPIGLLIMAIGFFLTGHFELNNQDEYHTKGHYTGVFLILAGSLSIGVVLKWSFLSVFLLEIQFGMCFGWFVFCALITKKSDDIRVVTRNSKWCIGIELAMFYVTNTILVLTIYASGKNEGNIMAHWTN